MTQISKLNLLLKSGRKLFHTQDLAVLWAMENRNSLYTVIKRMVKRGILLPVIKGLYSTVPLNEINKYQLGTALIHKYCYVSLETVLFNEGIIHQKIYPITFVSSVSQKVEHDGVLYIYRKMKPELFFSPDGIEEKDGYFIASRDRAISDILYFNPKYYFDSLEEDR